MMCSSTSDLVSVENQQHRLTVSGLEVPIGMKNPTSGDLKVMLYSISAAQSPHYFGKRNRLQVHPAWKHLKGATRQKKPANLAFMAPVMNRVQAELTHSLKSKRQFAKCRALASRIGAVAKGITDKEAKSKWLKTLHGMMKGKETIGSGKRKKRKDPCLSTLSKLLKAP